MLWLELLVFELEILVADRSRRLVGLVQPIQIVYLAVLFPNQFQVRFIHSYYIFARLEGQLLKIDAAQLVVGDVRQVLHEVLSEKQIVLG